MANRRFPECHFRMYISAAPDGFEAVGVNNRACAYHAPSGVLFVDQVYAVWCIVFGIPGIMRRKPNPWRSLCACFWTLKKQGPVPDVLMAAKAHLLGELPCSSNLSASAFDRSQMEPDAMIK